MPQGLEIPVQTQHNSDGSLQYIKYKYKGSIVKISTEYDKNGNLIGVSIPQFINIPHQQLFQIISAMFIHSTRQQDSGATGFKQIWVAISLGFNFTTPEKVSLIKSIQYDISGNIQNSNIWGFQIIGSVSNTLYAQHYYYQDDPAAYNKDAFLQVMDIPIVPPEPLTIQLIGAIFAVGDANLFMNYIGA